MITIVKIGGNIIDDETALNRFLEIFAQLEGPKLLVHGGGKTATALAKKLDVPQEMIGGRRVTSAATLELVTMTYAGLISKTITAKLNAMNCLSIGICGADADLLRAKKRDPFPVDFGFAGDLLPAGVNVKFLQQLFSAGITPVIAPVTHDGKGQLLNTNADTIAGCIATALAAETGTQLIFCFEKNGVLLDLSDEGSLLPSLKKEALQELSAGGKISHGMLPKIAAGFLARENGVQRVVIGNSFQLHEIVQQTASCTELL